VGCEKRSEPQFAARCSGLRHGVVSSHLQDVRGHCFQMAALSVALRGASHSFSLSLNLVRGLYHFVRAVTARGPAMRLGERTAQGPATRRQGAGLMHPVPRGAVQPGRPVVTDRPPCDRRSSLVRRVKANRARFLLSEQAQRGHLLCGGGWRERGLPARSKACLRSSPHL
jgi:hypothetical protein